MRKTKERDVADWCSCENWKEGWRMLGYQQTMNYCVFCGKKLEKKAKGGKKR